MRKARPAAVALLLRYAGFLDHPRPARGFGAHELREFFTAGRSDFYHQVFEPLLNLGHAQHGQKIAVDFADDGRGCAGGCAQAVP